MLHQARQAHQAGHQRQAELLCLQVLQDEPDNAMAWHLLGQACQGQGKLTDAAASYEQLIRVQPQSADGHFLLGSVCTAQGKRDQALDHYRQALQIQPGHAEALNAVGVALAQQRRLDEAVSHLRAACLSRPDFAPAHYNLGVALAEQGKPEEARTFLEQALRLRPDYAQAHYGLGNVLASQGQRDPAIACLREALRLAPGYGEAYNNLGLNLVQAGRPAEAVPLLEQAVRLRPKAAEAHNNLGLALADLGRFAQAKAAYREALGLRPDYTDAVCNLASACKEQGRLEEALAGYQIALWQQPNLPSTHWNRALALLQMGAFEEGWAEYEWRWRRKGHGPRRLPQPAWDGSDLAGKRLLIYCEQGLGDVLQFIRYAALVKKAGAEVVVECADFLMPLLGRCAGIDQLVAEGTPLPAFDVHAALLSLPHLLGTTLASVPAEVPYLFADPERVERWREELAGLEGFKIGIAWQGNRQHPWDRHRSFALACFEGLARLEGVRLVSLQKGAGAEQVGQLRGRFPVLELPTEEDAARAAFMDTAAVMQHLDLVISADTAIAHLAGGLGVPVWVALSAITDWRWLRGRDDSPWYPSMRLFRQKTLGDWEGVFDRLAAELNRLIREPSLPRSIPIEVAPGELFDKLTILEIKRERITDPAKLVNVKTELDLLSRVRDRAIHPRPELNALVNDLKRINVALWDREEDIRTCERAQDFGPRFLDLARTIYRHNDHRSVVKRQINELLGSKLIEEKSHDLSWSTERLSLGNGSRRGDRP
jgi:tetratricopeptide (TPR) repeat protein